MIDTNATKRDSPPQRWIMFAILLVGAFLPPLDFFIVNVALPDIRDELGISPAGQQLIISTYATMYAVMLITGGRLGDIYGRNRIFFIGLTGFALASTLCGLATSPWVLIIGRALQGLTAAIMAPQALASIQAIFPDAEKPRALGIYGAIFGLASVIGQVFGGMLISLNIFGLGWRLIFLVNIPIIILVLIFGLPLLQETRIQRSRRLDFTGVLLSVLTLGCVVIPLIEGREAGWPLWAWISLALSPVLAVVFWRYETRLAANGGEPLINPSAFQTPGLRTGLVVALLFYSIAAFFLLLSIYLQGALDETPLTAGLVFLPFGLGFLLGPLSTPIAGRWLGRFVNSAGMTLEAAGFIALIILISGTLPDHPPSGVLLALILFLIGYGQGLALPTLVKMIISRVDAGYSGMISGIINSTLQISAALSVAIIGGIFFSVLGSRHDVSAISSAFIAAMLCIAILLILGAILSFRIVRREQTKK
ncbi:MFS transporter [Xenorhabdus sp. PB30.3]|uniref:MFS transporter n=1 Tax=Xenorhabdus sp. PB30.3 TaxID=2788941 RepID=UPI001E4505B1|nr:MFS transporter [Xenorhabdus sp. PB30.3]MCC8381880.1 MFS transporter [Xenorhabdus sp. PB30.3]